jgi:putative transposase
MTPRAARQLVDGGTYHVLTRGNNGQPIFHDALDYKQYLQILTNNALTHHLHIYHFALMPNHVHLVLRVTKGEALSRAMLSVNLRYALYYQRLHAYTGHLWQGRFKSRLIDRDRDTLACGRYVELNPVRSGLVHSPDTYPWSSYQAYAKGMMPALLTPNPLYATLGANKLDRQHAYRQYIHHGMAHAPAEMTDRYGLKEMMRSSETTQWEPFVLGVIERQRGRPKKLDATN